MTGDDLAGEKIIDTRMCYVRTGPLQSNQCYFRPCLVYQMMLPEHVADGGLEFRFNITTGENEARFPGLSEADAAPGSARHDAILAAQVRIIEDAEARDDGPAVRSKLAAAATWGDEVKMAHLVRTCYVTREAASEALLDGAREGAEGVVRVLLAAGASADFASVERDAKTALYVACECGYEPLAAQLISAMSLDGLGRRATSSGLTAFELLRREDLSGMARRLEAKASERLEALAAGHV
ncbi:hypothetical protein CYMTET_43310 [Cymbomonas tetramitiformis]|uniref:Uncharacterized protein n=1 Tax=Cymbomonas tetramitiformis TaxID=36881 RepID=A0AAE0BZY4_9CHLO|nr:hypothetical protein CYMTET_45486 [Cymbomonas tetramitiformis]KAK3247181.1 hypothetical protein CYMTET_43310 [Cymbomonas tetramitiformis]|eukprot:gene4515-5531_t